MKGYIIMECHRVRHGVNRERPRATPVGENAAIRLIQVTTSPLTQSISITITALKEWGTWVGYPHTNTERRDGPIGWTACKRSWKNGAQSREGGRENLAA
jgi:hypothetical protein